MNNALGTLTELEKLQFNLRSLYMSSGYSKYTISKFEEYDLYANNKDFLVSSRVITFTDTDGKLMALKPDVTLSIIKNCKDIPNNPQKIFYDENVFRVSQDSLNFKEIKQSGLEFLGEVDDFRVLEVMALAVKSLDILSVNNALNVSNLDIVLGVIDFVGLKGKVKSQVLSLIAAKNVHGINEFCNLEGLSADKIELLEILASVYGGINKIEEKLLKLCVTEEITRDVKEFIYILKCLTEKFPRNKINVDFAVLSDTNYYNGITFNGVIEGIPNTVLSGGRYDKLMKRLNKKSGAVGFAIYLDTLSKKKENSNALDFDVTVLYSDKSDIKLVFDKAEELRRAGNRVNVKKDSAGDIKTEIVDLR